MTNPRKRSLTICIFLVVAVAGRLEAGDHEVSFPPINESLRIPDAELPKLKRRAKTGDADAALTLATYYGFFLDNREKRNRELQVHYYQVAATHGSETGIKNLIFTYSMDTDRFDLSKACHWRRELKRLAAQRNIQVQSDAEWYYDLYFEYFVARRSASSKRYKKLGLQFLECAARLGLREAQRELTEIYSDEPEVRGERKGMGACICGELSTDPEPASSPKSAATGAQTDSKNPKDDSHPPSILSVANVGHPPPRYQLVVQDNPAALRFDLVIFSHDDRPICISHGGWPNDAGHVNWGSQDVKVESHGRTFAARDWDFGYCIGDCMTRIPPHGTLKGFINYEEFGDPKQIADLPGKKLEYTILPHLCTPPTQPKEEKELSLSSVRPKTDHLIVVKERELAGYRAELESKLFVTPADIARMIVFPPWQPEFAVSVYSTPPASADDVKQYHVTVTRASANVLATGGPVQILRSDAELPASAALPLKEVWKEMLVRTRPYEAVEDSPGEQAIVQFAVAEPYGQIVRGELPPNPSSDISSFEGLGDVLVRYGEAKLEQRGALAEEIETTSKLLLRKKINGTTARLNDSLRIPKMERKVLRQKAKQGDIAAVEKLSSYYSIYQNNSDLALRYWELGAKHNSQTAIVQLMTLYSTDTTRFDFKKVLGLRNKLKKLAETQPINLRSDADWAYDRYRDLADRGEKRHGLFFLEYAARHRSRKALDELVQLYSKDPDFQNPTKARYWKQKITAYQ